MLEEERQEYKVTLEDGSEVEYMIRGLDEEEIRPWAMFCASVFAYKANPPTGEYFERHYVNDPYRDNPSLIRVAIYDGEIVASCRLFLRTISSGNDANGNSNESSSSSSTTTTWSAGGIGEVCTSDKHRRRGLSKILLQNVIGIMKERKLQVSLLHAAPEFFKVYEKAGDYACTKSCWSAVKVDVKSLLLLLAAGENNKNVNDDAISVRKANFPDDTATLSKLHQAYSERRFAGCIVRSEAYWNDYLSRELGDSLLVLTQKDSNDNSKIVAWLSLRPRGVNRMQLREFGVDEESSGIISTGKALSMLLAAALSKSSNKGAKKTNHEGLTTLLLPTYIFDAVSQEDAGEVPFLMLQDATSEDDNGWMYKIFDDQIDFQTINGSSRPHLIWPADSF